MNYLLIALAVFAGMALFTALVWFLIKSKLKKLLGELSTALGAAGSVPPFELELEQKPDSKWNNQSALDTATEEMKKLGYTQLDDYELVNEMMKMNIRAFHHQGLGAFAALYDSPSVPLFADLVSRFSDNTALTVSCGKEQGVDHPEFVTKVYMTADLKDTPSHLEELHHRLQAEISGNNVAPWGAGEFLQGITEAYKREMDWRIERGGVTAQEVVRVGELSGQKTPDKSEIKVVQDIWRESIESEVDERCRNAFFEQINWSETEKNGKTPRLSFVHFAANSERMIGEFLDHYITEEIEESDEGIYEKTESRWTKMCKGLSAKETFSLLNAEMPVDKAFALLGTLEHPYVCEVYLTPERKAYDEDFDEDFEEEYAI